MPKSLGATHQLTEGGEDMAEYQITDVHLGYGAHHESHIQSVWVANGTRPYTVQEIVEAIDHGDTFFYTIGGERKARVITELSTSGHRYIRTHPDDTKLDNLLHLQKF